MVFEGEAACLSLTRALDRYRRSKLGTPGSHTKPDLLVFDPQGGGILIIDLSFASERRIEAMDDIRRAVPRHPQWWDAEGKARLFSGPDGQGCPWGRTPDGREVPLAPLFSLPRVATASDNALVPVDWDAAGGPLLSAQAQRYAQVLSCDSTSGAARVRALRRLVAQWYPYSPRARYINRYTELLGALQRALVADCPLAEARWASEHAEAMDSRADDGLGAAVFGRHRVVPLVMGSAGWVSKALERELRFLFQRGKKNDIGSELAGALTLYAYDAAVGIYRKWFRPT